MDITLKLSKDFERCLEDLKKKYGEDFEYINGLHPSQLDFSEFIDNFVDKDTLADASIDPNANANHKDIRSFMTEKAKSEDKLFGLNKIFLTIKKQWGLRTAKQWLEQEFSKGFYLNDSTTASYFPYCWANDLTRLATEGLFFLTNYNHQAPKHLTTYFDDVIEFVSFLSNRSPCGRSPQRANLGMVLLEEGCGRWLLHEEPGLLCTSAVPEVYLPPESTVPAN